MPGSVPNSGDGGCFVLKTKYDSLGTHTTRTAPGSTAGDFTSALHSIRRLASPNALRSANNKKKYLYSKYFSRALGLPVLDVKIQLEEHS